MSGVGSSTGRPRLLRRLFGRKAHAGGAHDDILRDCPECAELIFVYAARCRHCGITFAE